MCVSLWLSQSGVDYDIFTHEPGDTDLTTQILTANKGMFDLITYTFYNTNLVINIVDDKSTYGIVQMI